MVALTLKANVALFQRKLEWMALLLESRDVRERLGDGLIDRLLKALTGGRSDEFSKLGPAAASSAGDLTVDVEIAGVLDEVFTALRALGFEFHEAPMESPNIELMHLVQRWERQARTKLECGLRTADPMGRRLVEHGGMCYFNCAAELRRALGAASLPPLPIRAEQ